VIVDNVLEATGAPYLRLRQAPLKSALFARDIATFMVAVPADTARCRTCSGLRIINVTKADRKFIDIGQVYTRELLQVDNPFCQVSICATLGLSLYAVAVVPLPTPTVTYIGSGSLLLIPMS
jgi:hypothetical protein